MKGVIVFSFAWRKKGHSPCNVRLADAAIRIVRELEKNGESVIVVAQRTIAAIMREQGFPADMAIKKGPGYEGSEEVMEQALYYLLNKAAEAGEEVTEVIPVAQPVLQLTKCVSLVTRHQFRTWSFWKLVTAIGWIGFDRLSVQPGTRGPVRLLYYAARQILFGYRNPVEQSEP